MVRSDDWADPSFAARREARRLGTAMAASIPMIATTMRSSISEKPSCCLFFIYLLQKSISCLHIGSLTTAERDFFRISKQNLCQDKPYDNQRVYGAMWAIEVKSQS